MALFIVILYKITGYFANQMLQNRWFIPNGRGRGGKKSAGVRFLRVFDLTDWVVAVIVKLRIGVKIIAKINQKNIRMR